MTQQPWNPAWPGQQPGSPPQPSPNDEAGVAGAWSPTGPWPTGPSSVPAPGPGETVVKPDRFRPQASPAPTGHSAQPASGSPAGPPQALAETSPPGSPVLPGQSTSAGQAAPGGLPHPSGSQGWGYQSPSTDAGQDGSNPPLQPYRPSETGGPRPDQGRTYAQPSGTKASRFQLGTTFGLVVLALNVILGGIIVTMLLRWPQPPPPAPQSSPTGWSTVRRPTAAPTTVSLGFSVAPPDGWTLSPDPGSVVKVVHPQTNSRIVVYTWVSTDPPISFCDKQARSAAVWHDGTVTPLPDASFPTGEAFPGYRMEGSLVQVMRCVAHGERVFIVISEAQPARAETAAQGYDQFIASWTWT